jgi:hypothetical protein
MENSKRTRAFALVAALSFAVGGVLAWAATASAATVIDPVGGGAFQLDGNALQSVPAATAGDDWDNVCHQVSAAACPSATNTNNATAVSWVAEPNPNSSIFTGGGSKDPQDISNWAWKDGAGGLPDKDNLQHGFAARYSQTPSATCPSTGPGGVVAPTCEVLYFGSDRIDNSGDAQQGFWFFQNPITMNGGPVGGGTGFSGVHKAGDVLVISDFSNGGGTSTITVYSWDPTCTKTTGTTPGTCGDQNLRNLGTSTAANCATSPTPTPFCGIVNPTNGTAAPWAFVDKTAIGPTHPANTYLNGEFYEGGINLSTLGLSGECFASVASETRSSTSTTATLKDFILGAFAPCGSKLKTTPSVGAGGVSIGTGVVSGLTDSANLQVTGASTWSGTLKFSLCSPADMAALSETNCALGGTAIGSTINVDQSTTMPVVSAPAATVSSAGTYCWRGEFKSAKAGVPDATDPPDTTSTSECFTVNPVTAGVTTMASDPVTIGAAIDDTAHLTGTATEPGTPVVNGPAGSPAGGTITFNLYGPDDATCSTSIETSVVNVSGNGDYKASTGTLSGSLGSLTPKAAGTYRWIANYSGDSPNTLANPANTCNGATESVVVSPKNPQITTTASSAPPTGSPVGTALNDVAHLSGTAPKPNGSPAGGTITFNLYGPGDTTCSTPIETSVVNVSGDGDYSANTGTLSGTLGSLTPTVPGTYLWVASYSGDLPNTTAVSGHCGDANEASLLIQLNPSLSTQQSFVPNDQAHVTVDAGAGDLAGNVEFKLFVNNPTCDTNVSPAAYDSGTIDITTGTGTGRDRTVVSHNTTSYGTDGTTFNWLVTYTSTNQGHTSQTSSCTTEHSSIAVSNGP